MVQHGLVSALNHVETLHWLSYIAIGGNNQCWSCQGVVTNILNKNYISTSAFATYHLFGQNWLKIFWISVDPVFQDFLADGSEDWGFPNLAQTLCLSDRLGLARPENTLTTISGLAKHWWFTCTGKHCGSTCTGEALVLHLHWGSTGRLDESGRKPGLPKHNRMNRLLDEGFLGKKCVSPNFIRFRLACCIIIGFHCLQFAWRGVLCSDTWISGVSKRNWISEYFQNEPTLLDYYQINCVSFEEGNTRLAKSYLQYRHNLRPSLSSLMRGQLETCSN